MSVTVRPESEYLALFDKGIKWGLAGCYVAAYEALEQALNVMASTRTDPIIHIRCLWAMGTAAYHLGDIATAFKHFNDAVAFADSSGLSSHYKLQALVNVCIAHYWSGSFDKALRVGREGRRLFGPDVEPKLRADLDLTIGACALYEASDLELCFEANNRALEVYTEIGSVDGRATALTNLGGYHGKKGELHQAQDCFTQALKIASRARIPDTQVDACVELGTLHVRQGKPGAALRYALAAVEILWNNVAVLDKVALANLSSLFGLIYRAHGDSDSALQQLQRASYYFSAAGRWMEWERVTRLMDEMLSRPPMFQRYEVNARASERLRYFGALLELVDSIETTFPHVRLRSQVVTHYVLMLVDRMALPREERVVMSHAGRLHDVGMAAVDPEVVEASGPISEAGRRRLQAHVVVGENALRMYRLPEELYAAVRHHHENYDGSGYPDRLRSECIPRPARILALVDRYVELALKGRVWGGEETDDDTVVRHEAAMSRLWQEAGSRLDPELVAHFGDLHRSALSAAGEGESLIKIREGSR